LLIIKRAVLATKSDVPLARDLTELVVERHRLLLACHIGA
jgi:hypothetical protein